MPETKTEMVIFENISQDEIASNTKNSFEVWRISTD